MSEVRIAAEPRTEFGKGAARRTRRAGKVPAVLYGHGTDPQHISLPGHDLMLALKTPNVLLTIEGLAGGAELALPKDVQRDPIKGFLEHVDLLLVKRGEKVVVDLPVNLVGDVVPGGVVQQEVVQVSVEAEATHIPQAVDLSIEGIEVGTQVLAGDLKLPSGVTLMLDAEALILQIADATVSAGETEAAAEGEAAEAPEEAPAAEADESAE
ncbi:MULTISPECIES: 50S ribosomal protein L25/general stress protein Ctc [Actinomadura]|uniref:Large ribosomal subunit protein bL25 n=1 Tax=Actinomadura madurae TaxID=1993 RepID=A0A1I5CXX4_9ACTN|nr:50S ribosomal protein L25/general stress protein Ctc [Actinomadura madurae]MCP9950302.1 50S ribosomal protein L25/general stress protein Ctc [Actinomadura madurae]MCP9967082.1 50S ribosomal protein L25/general stress protein Ctc [Actinomadura madurae]MCQ0008924.1 50S ribosomal protein L25/general stress protein Ctc [Actinomadura madurae]URM95860.1 50S ribosomal protein L25/general stress protein Ctc [Actinomadura madurae]URN06555.1 50S ribosomal protein L25/general stress protein Ctc [Actin